MGAHQNNSASILLITEDESFLEAFKSQSDVDIGAVDFTPNLELATSKVRALRNHYDGIFLDPSFRDWMGLKTLSEIHSMRPGANVYLLVEGIEELIKKFQVDQAGIERLVYNKEEAVEILEIIDDKVKKYQTYNIDEDCPILLEEEKALGHLVPIKAANFITGSESAFDVFVKINKLKYIKILSIGDTFDLDRLENYLNKGLKHFYISKKTQEKYVNFCGELADQLANLKSNKVSSDVIVNQTLNFGHEISSLFAEHGITEETINYGYDFTKSVSHIIEKNSEDNGLIKSLLSDIVAYEHSAGCTFVAGLLARELGVETHLKTNVVGLAACLHDIGLYKIQSSYDEEGQKLLDEIEMEKALETEGLAQSKFREIEGQYKSHPLLGMKEVSELKDVSSLVPQVILQHHERLDGSGFPEGLKGGEIHLMAQVVGIADEFVKLLSKLKTFEAKKEDYANFSENLNGKFSVQVRRAWEQVFLSEKEYFDIIFSEEDTKDP